MNFHSTPLPPKKRTLNKNQEEINPSKHPPIHTVSVFLDQAIFEPFFPWYICEFFFQYYSGSKSLNPVRRPPLCPSMHRSQWSIGQNMADTTFDTEYSKTYFEKDIIPVSIFGYSQDQFRHPLHGSSRFGPKKRQIE